MILPLLLLLLILSLSPDESTAFTGLHSKTRNGGCGTASSLFLSKHEQGDERILENAATVENSDRRSLFRKAAVLSAALLLGNPVAPAHAAYGREYPIELQSTDAGASQGRRERKVNRIREQQQKEQQDAVEVKPQSAAVWASALWFLSGSRSTPVATPLANALYDPSEEQWLKDRNDGLFAELPLALMAALTVVFFAAGAVMDTVVQAVVEPSTSLPLACVSLVFGGAFELGRIASGDKGLTRQESDRATLLETEFEEFAQARLRSGGTCHRQEVVRAFRRYFAKYRQESSEDENSMTDLEIERLIRAWSQAQLGVEMSPSGFFKGIQINTNADLVLQR
jgi:hypothetical protein